MSEKHEFIFKIDDIEISINVKKILPEGENAPKGDPNDAFRE